MSLEKEIKAEKLKTKKLAKEGKEIINKKLKELKWANQKN